ncbi:MAG TPA: RNA polymerase sigma-70 factor [Bacteroidales bacterium]|nr:RNA polymerase sigma-70 factor [Bacteroidales bacterium]
MESGQLDRIKSGDEKTFKEVFFTYYPSLLNFANSYIHDRFVAENAVQDAFITFWEKKEDLDPNTNVRAFLGTIVKHKALNILEKTRNRSRINENIQNIKLREINIQINSLQALNPEELFGNEIEDIISKALEELPENTRQVFVMSRYDNISHQKIAQQLGISTKGVEYHITKALKHLKSRLADYLSTWLLW